MLESLWPYGFSSIGEVTFESAAYVARYIMKKITGDMSDYHYDMVDSDGELVRRVPEFCHMPLKPGIGHGFVDKYTSDIYPDGRMVVRSNLVVPPRYYDKIYKRLDRDKYDKMKSDRLLKSFECKDRFIWRLAVREKIANSRVKLFNRKLEV